MSTDPSTPTAAAVVLTAVALLALAVVFAAVSAWLSRPRRVVLPTWPQDVKEDDGEYDD